MVIAEREPIMGVLGLYPQPGPWAEPLVGGEGAKMLKTFRVFEFERSYILTTNLLYLPRL